MRIFAALVVATWCAQASSAHAQRQTFTLNPDASEVKMTLDTTHEVVHGTFHLQAGTIQFDPAMPMLSGSVTVLAAGQTGSSMRDKRMNGSILNVEKYATVSFAPKSYTGTLAAAGDSTIQVTGIFTLLGTPHEITVPMQVHLDGTAATAKAHFMVPYVQWGLKNPSLLMWKVDNNVAIDLSLVGRVTR